ncbi:MAG: YncE family protein [Terriglobales bacterium]
MKRLFWLGLVVSIALFLGGCGDTFRPIITPNPPTFPNPAAAHTVVAISDNGTTVPGSAMVIDVSGDSEVSVVNVGLAPVHAAQQSASEVLVVNQAVPSCTPVPCSDSITRLNFSNTTINSTNTISLPANSAPSFVAIAPSDTLAYVTLPSYVPPSVGVVSTASNSLVNTIQVGNNPVAVAVTPDKSKLYVANQVDGTISAFNTNPSDRLPTPRPISGALTSAPIWLVPRTDSQRVYVLEQTSGILASIDTTSTAGPDILTESAINVPNASIMTYDPNLNRLYIPGGQQLAIVDVSQTPPQYLAGGAPIPTCDLVPTSANCIPTASPSSRGASDPCSLTSAQALTVVAVAALPDGSRAYVEAYYEDSSNNICPQVTVIDATSNLAETPSIAIPGFPDATIQTLPGGLPNPYYVPACVSPVPPAPYRATFRFMMAAGGDSSRAYLSSCDAGNVNIIETANETYIENLPAPISASPPIPPNSYNPPQNPVFLFAGP